MKTGQVHGKTARRHTSEDFLAFITQIVERTPGSKEIHIVLDNLSAHKTKSVTEFLTIVSQIARGDLTLRGRVSNDALGNVVDSVNYMLDNFAKVLERVRKAAIDVQSSANEITAAFCSAVPMMRTPGIRLIC